jgi:hypothetical protein
MSTDRRSFLTRLGAGVTVAGGALASGVSVAGAQSSSAGFSPAKHTQDDWMDRIPGKHRMVFDTTTPGGFGAALLYANNYLISSASGYGLKDQDAAIIIVARHFATPFAYSDAMWAKYGKAMPPVAALDDPKTKQRAVVNMYGVASYADGANMGTTIDEVVKKGVHFAVCQLATTFFSGLLAQSTGGQAASVYTELTSNLIGNSHLVASGILGVNRAQERGFTLATAV